MRDPMRIGECLRTLTVNTLPGCEFNGKTFRVVLTAVAQGVVMGTATHGHDPREVLKPDVRAMDEAFTRTAHASNQAVKELTAKGQDRRKGAVPSL